MITMKSTKIHKVNPVAKSLSNPKYRQQVIPNKKKITKPKHKKDEINGQQD